MILGMTSSSLMSMYPAASLSSIWRLSCRLETDFWRFMTKELIQTRVSRSNQTVMGLMVRRQEGGGRGKSKSPRNTQL